LSGDNATASYTGRVIIDDGVVSVAADSNLGDPDTLDADRLILKGGTLSASSNFTLDTNRGITLSTGGGTINVVSGRTLTYGGVIDGTSTFYKSGAGTLILSGTNTNTGSTSITAGTLRVTGALDDTAVSVSSGATYDVDATDAVANISGAGTVDIASGVTLTVGSNNLSTTLSGVISGDGNLIKVGTGRITLSGANDYTGSTTVSAGYLRAQHNTALGTTAGNTNVANGATLELIGGITIGSGEDLTIIGDGMSDGNYLGALRNVSGTNTYQGSITLSTSTSRIVSSAGTLNISGNIINGSIDLIISGSGDTSVSGVIGNGSGTLSKRGNGTLTLSGTNTFTGSTTISAGTLSISADNNLGNPDTLDADRLTFNGGTLLITETITLNTNRGITLSTDGGTINVANTKTVTYDGVITGSTAFTKDGNGILDLGGTNIYTGATNIDDGTLQITGALAQTAVTVASGATYDSDTTDTIGSIDGAGAIEINTGTTLTVGGNNTSTTHTGVISGAGNLIKEGTGTLTLQGTNTYTGDTTVNDGAITVSGSGKLGNGSYSGTLVVATSKTFNYSSSSVQTFSDWGAGTGTINLSGSGTVTLSGDQNFTGTLNVSQMLVMYNGTSGSDTGLGKATTIDIKNGGTIKVQQGADADTSNNAFIGAQRSGGPDIYIRTGGELTTDASNGERAYHIGANLTLDGGTLSWGNSTVRAAYGTWILNQNVAITDDSLISAPAIVVCNNDCASTTVFTVDSGITLTVSGNFFDAANFTETAIEKAGAGTMILQAASTITTGFTVSAGTLAVTANNALGTSATGTTIASGAILDLRGVTYSTTEAITNNGGTIATSTGTSTFAGVITLGANSTFDVSDGAQLTASGVIQDGVSTYGITKNGDGKLILSGANTYDGTTTISNGSLRAAHNTALGATTGDTTVASGAALELIGGITIASGEDLTLVGTGESSTTGALRNISGDNAYNGNITLSTSAVRINSDSGTLTIGGTISNGSIGLTFGGAGNITVNGVIGNGAGTVTKDGAGTLTLTADNTYTGATTISDGIVAITHANALGTTANASTVASGATLSISNGITIPEAITISGTGDGSVGAIRFTGGANTYSGAIVLGANATISSTGTGGTTFGGTINASSSGAQSLTISTSTDDLTISGVIGGTTRPSTVDISATGVC
jgi:fibronectin-binding autotransporter adhesin